MCFEVLPRCSAISFFAHLTRFVGILRSLGRSLSEVISGIVARTLGRCQRNRMCSSGLECCTDDSVIVDGNEAEADLG